MSFAVGRVAFVPYKGENGLLGAVCGDILGSYYEWHPVKSVDFDLFPRGSHFTDDTVLTVAVADTLLSTEEQGIVSDRARAQAYAQHYRHYYARYPDAGFGTLFREWATADTLRRQHSYANGAAMRVSPIAWAMPTLEEVLREAAISCRYTHSHPQAIKGAQAVAAAVYLARTACSKEQIKTQIEKRFGYSLSFTLENIRPHYVFDSRAEVTVPPAIVAFLESWDYESAVRKAVSLGGDSDTLACMAGGIAQAYYQTIPAPIVSRCELLLDSGLRQTIRAFNQHYAL